MSNVKKTSITRTLSVLLAMIITVMTFGIARPVTAYAADLNTAEVLTATPNMQILSAQQQQQGNNQGGADATGDSVWSDIISTFVKWIKRLGFLVAFVGAIMFALSVKNNDAENKQNGILTMIAGFLAVAICTGVDKFGITSALIPFIHI